MEDNIFAAILHEPNPEKYGYSNFKFFILILQKVTLLKTSGYGWIFWKTYKI